MESRHPGIYDELAELVGVWIPCAWCWDELSRTETHTVVMTLAAPHLELHLHHACFDPYRNTSDMSNAAIHGCADEKAVTVKAYLHEQHGTKSDR